MKNNKKYQSNKLISNAKTELLKTQQLAISTEVKEQLSLRKNKKLRSKIIVRDEIEKTPQTPSSILLDRIQDEQDFLDDLRIEIGSETTETYASNDKTKAIIAELRRTDPKAADALENSLCLKKTNKKSGDIVNKRI